MTRAEHYLEAERLEAQAWDYWTDHDDRAAFLAAAQVHATLAGVDRATDQSPPSVVPRDPDLGR